LDILNSVGACHVALNSVKRNTDEQLTEQFCQLLHALQNSSVSGNINLFYTCHYPKYVTNPQMHSNIYDVLYSQYSHQHVSAGIPAILRVMLAETYWREFGE
jgi:hypothetical protein